MLDAAELAQIQADAASAACDLPCVIERAQNTLGAGGYTTAWNVVSPPGLKAGMTEPSGGQLANYEYMVGDLAIWHICFPFGTDVQELDRLVITGKDGTVQTLSVIKRLTPRSYAALTSVLAAE
jgi:hypothetical protein